MTELLAKTPCGDLLPLSIGGVEATEERVGAMTVLAPFKGQEKSLSAAMKAAHGTAFPANGRMTGRLGGGACALWFGQGQAVLIGAEPDAGLAKHAAITDQSDAWASVRLSGPAARDVLARLTPLDIRDDAFAIGTTARIEVAHMMGALTRLDTEDYMVMVFRSMAGTLVHDLREAMESVAGRSQLAG